MGSTAYRYVQSSAVHCAEMSQLVTKELVMKSEMYQLRAKHSPADLTILFICHELASLNSSVVTHANLPIQALKISLVSAPFCGMYVKYVKLIKTH